ncbi:DNA helicase B isoform X2 [Rana temporaria]|uniref:DNA helicase B isoform X2 n=1 Tax=Rana temporaria TaxID=8407 RepID=UPI001AAD26E5|nr:DNA helicase B isoform X2 [Rana temporaria]
MSNLRVRGRCGGAGLIKLKGRLLPVKKEAGESDGDEDAETGDRSDPEFLDAEEIEEGALQIPSFSPQNTRVKILTEDSKEYIVTGFFPLTDPWWSVTVDVKQGHSQYFVKGFPSYKLEDDILGKESMLSLFLNECKVHEDFITSFMTWVKYYPPVTFSRLLNLAEEFKENHQKDIVCYLSNSACCSFVLKALQIPLVLRYLPKLLPHKMRGFLKLDAKDPLPASKKSPDILPDVDPPTDLLLELEKILDTAPWKFGFGVLLYRQLHLCGCEATLDSFLQCDANLLGKIPDLQLNALYVYNELKKKCMSLGDTYVEQSALTKAASNEMSAESAWEAIGFLKEEKIVVIEQERVFLYNYYFYEVDIAEFITKLVMKKALNPKVEGNDVLGGDHTSQREEKLFCLGSQTLVHEFSDEQIRNLQINDFMTEENHPMELDAEQQRAARMILANPVTIISGKGGCGKTTVVSRVFKAVMQEEKDEVEKACKALEDDMDASEEWDFNAMTPSCKHSDVHRVLLTAPTGKAASLLRKKTELPAATLHQITCSYSAWKTQQRKKEESGEEHKSPWKFHEVEVLVVDEGSLVSIRIFSAVLKLLCTHARLEKLVILGDVRQLPSIEPGNLLADIFATFKGMNWAIELKTNHRAESQLIVENATHISNQQCMDFDAVLHFDGNTKPAEMPSEEKKCILVSLAHETDLITAIKALIENSPGLQDDKHSQFIAFRRKDCLLINELCCTHYSGHTMKNSRNRYDFRCSDKVCCTKNAYVKDLLTRSRTRCADQNENDPTNQSDDIVCCTNRSQCSDENNTDHMTQSQEKCADDERICNGEIFYITDDVEKEKIRELTLSDGEEREYTLNYKALRSRSGLNYAWARTIHTFQGSEEDTVAYVLGTAGRQNWKHVYTAVTRGRKHVYIIANSAQLDLAIANKSRERKTRLQQRLKDSLSNRGAWPQSGASASTKPLMTQDKAAVSSSQEHPYTQLKSPPRFRCSSVPTTPNKATSSSPSGSPVNRESRLLEESSSQKRAGNPVHGMETTPSKLYRPENSMNVAEISPSSRLQNLSIHSSCNKQLFDH